MPGRPGTVVWPPSLDLPFCGYTTQPGIYHGGKMTTHQQSNLLSNKIIGAAIEVHKTLGPGLLESVYEECLCYELSLRNINYTRQIPLPVVYKGVRLDCGYRMDVVVEDLVIVEIKSIEKLRPIDEAQLITHLKLRNTWLGLLINFNVPVLRDGIKRLVMGY